MDTEQLDMVEHQASDSMCSSCVGRFRPVHLSEGGSVDGTGMRSLYNSLFKFSANNWFMQASFLILIGEFVVYGSLTLLIKL
jgi:hypothetical protein